MDLPELATILREYGDKVLNSESKLSLSTALLQNLNESFGLIVDEQEALNSTFQVIGTSSSKVDLLIDLQFLHDFVQRAVSLKLIPNQKDIGQVDIRKFKNLKLLEVRKIPVNIILGLNYLRNQLQYLTCNHSITHLRELFVVCGGDKSDKYVWNDLKSVNLSYNNLKYLDNSLEYVPWLQSLDLSHNKLVNVQAIDCLINLKYLNLGYNLLEAVPLFNKELSRKLQVLILKNNYIEDITGLVLLDSLITLDLSSNCLVDHQNLTTLPYLSSLQWLNLEGNPLFFHPDHRNLTSSRLHSNISSLKFMLNGVLLTKSEKLHVGSYVSKISRIPRSQRESPRMHHESISSNASVNTFASAVTAINTDSLTRSQKKEKKIRDAVISDMGDEDNDPMTTSIGSVSSIEASTEYLETKKQIEILRNKYGEKWLQNVGGSMVQDVLGIPKDQLPKMSSSPYEEDFKLHAAGILEVSANNSNIFETSGKYYDAKTTNDKTDVASELSANNTFLTASENSIYDGDSNSNSIKTGSCSDTEESENHEDEQTVFLVQRKHTNGDDQEMFLTITNRSIKERDLDARTINKWYHDMLMKCELTSTNPSIISIKYNRQKRDLQNRDYIVSDETEAESLLKCLKEIEKNNDNFRILYECMKCCHKFEIQLIDMKISDEKSTCPSCNSTLVAKVHVDRSKEDKSNDGDTSFDSCQTVRAETPSECSIGSAASVEESNDSLVNSNEHLYENSMRKYESDIEVISNPSQSSIEVLDDHSRPGRKRSSEERRMYPMPTIHDVAVTPNLLPIALTESSSSGSVSESVCTAYEAPKGTQSRPESSVEIRTIMEEEKEKEIPVADNKTGLISSIFEGFFTGVKEGTKSVTKLSTYKDNDNEIKFNITENFSNIDHRVKLHLYQHIFEDEYEDFVWLLRCSLLRFGVPEIITACLVLSTQKIYTLQIKDHQDGEEIMGWLIKKDSYTIDRLQAIYSLPWNQGVGVKIRTTGKNTINHLCFLQDIKHTASFFTYLTDNPLPESCSIVTTFPQQPLLNLQQALLSADDNEINIKSTTVALMSVFTKCTVTNNVSIQLYMGAFIVTGSEFILIQDMNWLMPDSTLVPKLEFCQAINNLLELEFEGNMLEFHFLDEVKGYEEVWYIDCGSEDNRNTIILATQVPWEKIFSVPLQVSHKVHVV